MASFVLVHGAWHGAWCWDELTPRLTAAGHQISTVDLPGTSDDPDRAAAATLDDGVAAVLAALPQGEAAWLVGHSMGGAVVSAAAEAAPERLAGVVYVTAVLPLDGETGVGSVGREDRGELDTATLVEPERGLARIWRDLAGPVFYPLCSPAQVALARERLAEWQGLAPMATPVARSPDRAGRVPAYYVECLKDRVLTIGDQRRMYGRVGMAGVRSLDTDHSPFFSDVDGLAAALMAFAA